MKTVKVFLDKRNQKRDGTYPVKICVYHTDRIILSTGFFALEKNWAGCEYSETDANNRVKNMALHALVGRVEQFLFNLEMRDELKEYTDKRLRDKIAELIGSKPQRTRTFTDVLDRFLSTKTNEGTRGIYIGTRNKILQYDAKCTLESMDNKWLMRFEAWMAQTLKVNARAIHLRNIRAVFNYAIDEELTKNYPFRKFSIKKEETRKRSLTVEQLRKLRDYPCQEYQERYRDLFMLMFYLIGINAADLFNAKKKDVVNGRLEYKRAKTGKLYSVKIEPEAAAIIKKYAGKGEYLLNIKDIYKNYKDFLHRMNVGLKQIGACERRGRGGKKIITPLFPDLSGYWSRHTWATIAADLEIPIETISRALGHSIGSPTTSIYIRFNQNKVDEANRRVIDYVNG